MTRVSNVALSLMFMLPFIDAVDTLTTVLKVRAMNFLILALFAVLLGHINILHQLCILQCHIFSIFFERLILGLQFLDGTLEVISLVFYCRNFGVYLF